MRPLLKPFNLDLLNLFSIKKLATAVRYAYNLDGVDDYFRLPFRAINPDGDIDIEWEQRGVLLDGVVRTIISQAITSSFATNEFRICNVASNRLNLLIGGNSIDLLTFEQGWSGSGKFRVTLIGTAFTVYKNGSVVNSGVFSRGAAREPAAQTMIGVQLNGAGVYYRYWVGVIFNVKINGTLWPMTSRNQSTQLSEPSGLGAELLVNPGMIGSASGWGKDNITIQNLNSEDIRLINSQASYAGAVFQSVVTIPGFVYVIRFKVKAQTASTNFRVSINSSAAAQYTGDLHAANYSTSDQYQFVMFTATTALATVRLLCNSSNLGAYVDVSNITVKPIGTANQTQLIANGDFSNGTAGWSVLSGGSLAVTSGQATLTTTANQNSRLDKGLILEAGSYYQASVKILSINSLSFVSLRVIRGVAGNYTGIASQNITSAGVISFIFMATATDAIIQVTGDGFNAGSFVFDDVSLRKMDTLCNPAIMVNSTPERWVQV